MGLKSLLGGSKTESAKKRAPLRNESLREDPADDLKRIARRRLIGAVALLLLAIIILPLVLEDAPKPVSADIALQIPSRDLAVRSNPEAAVPLADDQADRKVDAKSGAKADANQADVKLADTKLQAAQSQSDARAESKSDASPDPKPGSKPEPKLETKLETKLENKPEPKPAAKPEPKVASKAAESKPSDNKSSDGKFSDARTPEPKAGKHLNVVQSDDPIASFANAKPASSASSSANTHSPVSAATVSSGRSNHWVQIGAFGNEGKAREMASQLRGKGYPAVTEVVRGGNGGNELYRVRVGPLETKESASRARDNLAKSGFEGAVVQ